MSLCRSRDRRSWFRLSWCRWRASKTKSLSRWWVAYLHSQRQARAPQACEGVRIVSQVTGTTEARIKLTSHVDVTELHAVRHLLVTDFCNPNLLCNRSTHPSWFCSKHATLNTNITPTTHAREYQRNRVSDHSLTQCLVRLVLHVQWSRHDMSVGNVCIHAASSSLQSGMTP